MLAPSLQNNLCHYQNVDIARTSKRKKQVRSMQTSQALRQQMRQSFLSLLCFDYLKSIETKNVDSNLQHANPCSSASQKNNDLDQGWLTWVNEMMTQAFQNQDHSLVSNFEPLSLCQSQYISDWNVGDRQTCQSLSVDQPHKGEIAGLEMYSQSPKCGKDKDFNQNDDKIKVGVTTHTPHIADLEWSGQRLTGQAQPNDKTTKSKSQNKFKSKTRKSSKQKEKSRSVSFSPVSEGKQFIPSRNSLPFEDVSNTSSSSSSSSFDIDNTARSLFVDSSFRNNGAHAIAHNCFKGFVDKFESELFGHYGNDINTYLHHWRCLSAFYEAQTAIFHKCLKGWLFGSVSLPIGKKIGISADCLNPEIKKTWHKNANSDLITNSKPIARDFQQESPIPPNEPEPWLFLDSQVPHQLLIAELAKIIASFDWDSYELQKLERKTMDLKEQSAPLNKQMQLQSQDETLKPISEIYKLLNLDKEVKLIQCKRCKSWRIRFFFVQTRSSDEALTTKCECIACGRTWTQPS